MHNIMDTFTVDFAKVLSNDNTKQIGFSIVFFLFFIGISMNLFKDVFGCELNSIFKHKAIKHTILILFLFMIFQHNGQEKSNPLHHLLLSFIIYVVVLILSYTNVFYIYFVSIIVIFLFFIEYIKSYYLYKITDQEVLQEKLDFIYKLDNVLLIIIILTIIIGFTTSTKKMNLLRGLFGKNKCN